MKVILREDVEKVGRAGEVKEVSTGFGRNYLLPRRLAQPATAAALKAWDKGREKREELLAARTAQAKELAERLKGVSLSFSRPVGAEGRLFGSVGRADVVKSLKSCGFSVEKQAVALESAIKQAGEHEVEIRLMPEASARIKVTIVPRQ